MFKFENILVCLDLTDMDDYLIRYADFLVESFKPAAVTFIHVMDNYEFPEELADAFSDDQDKPLKEILLEEIHEKVDKNYQSTSSLPANVVIEEGHTVERIVKYAQKNRIDLALMGKKIDYEGQGGVVKKIIGLIPSSVLLVSETSHHYIKKMMVRTNFAQPSVIAFQAANYIKEQTDAEIEFHHVYKLPYNYFPVQEPKEIKKLRTRLAPHIEKSFQKFREKYKISDEIPFEFSVNVKGNEAQAMYDYALKNKIDLVITGTRLKSHLANLILDSTSEKLASFEKNIPVLIVKDLKQFVGFFKALFD
jgi:nucleotide-binding universal stress UspA family protein